MRSRIPQALLQIFPTYPTIMKHLFAFLFAFLLSAIAMLCAQSGIQRVSRSPVTERGDFSPELKPFYHGVASGDPGPNSVVIWTRVTPDGNPASIAGNYYVSTDPAFKTVLKTGSFTTTDARDYTVNLVIEGLNPGTTYYYYFQALQANSLIGRAKTSPTGDAVNHLRFATVSCSNYEGGYFNAYRAVADRNDLDAVIHLGDYIYEYGTGVYGTPLPNRTNQPPVEILSLADYRTRYSLYRLDPDLIRLHQQHTMISIWDDHESANDSWKDGAQNHQPNEGSWNARKAVSKQVYFEWMPVRDNAEKTVYRKLSYGNLCDILMLDTRLEGRVEPPPHFDTPDDPVRTIISPTQYNWLINNLKQSKARWKIIGNQVLFSTLNVGFGAGIFDGSPDLTNIDSIRQAEDLFIDNWESYPTQRDGIIDSLRLRKLDNAVFITGDSHCSWAFDVTKQPALYPVAQFFNIPQANPYNPATGLGYTQATGAGSWAVEFGTPSVSSPNFDETVGSTNATRLEQLINTPLPLLNAVYNPHLKYVDLDRHGYFILDLKPEAAQANFYYMSTVRMDTVVESFGKAALTLNGQNRIQVSDTPSPEKSVKDLPAPLDPLKYSVGTKEDRSIATIFSCHPNPTQGELYLQIGLLRRTNIALNVYDLSGKKIRSALESGALEAGVYNLAVDLGGLPAGTYFVNLENAGGVLGSKKVVLR
jgi:alkaline phosphatase D